MYQFDKKGKMIRAVRTPDAFIPIRNGTTSFSAASPPIYNPDLKIKPEDPTSGRGNNQGLEALTASPDGKYLYTLLQSATIQDGGKSSSKRRNSRFLSYRVKDKSVTLEAEYAVQLPVLPSGRVTGQSEMIYVSDTQFLVLARDSGAGHGQSNSQSIYRNADVIDISKATNVVGKYDGFNGSIASKDGVLKSEITPAEYCPFLSYNVNPQLNRFGVRNGGAQDANLLNEKWESFAFLEVDDDDSLGEGEKDDDGKDYYLISFSDNDFITQNGKLCQTDLVGIIANMIVQDISTLASSSTKMRLSSIWTHRFWCSRLLCLRDLSLFKMIDTAFSCRQYSFLLHMP